MMLITTQLVTTDGYTSPKKKNKKREREGGTDPHLILSYTKDL